ncbi:MAG: EamA family transporter [Candidatus Eiseniibacteriota bacterium]
MTFELTSAVVLTAAALHAVWNGVLKGSRGRLLSIVVMTTAGAVACLFAVPFVPFPSPRTWMFLGLSMVVHLGYFLMLIGAYRFGDLSRVYPIARGFGPALVAVLSPALLGEVLAPREILGIATICAGVASLAFLGGGRTQARGTWLALGTGVFIAAYTIVDGRGVRSAPTPFTYIVWMNLVEGLPLLGWVLLRRRGDIQPFLRREGAVSVLAGGLAALAYGLVIWAWSAGAVAPIAALRETSVVLAAWIGARHLGEPFGRRRATAAAVVAAGSLILAFR